MLPHLCLILLHRFHFKLFCFLNLYPAVISMLTITYTNFLQEFLFIFACILFFFLLGFLDWWTSFSTLVQSFYLPISLIDPILQMFYWVCRNVFRLLYYLSYFFSYIMLVVQCIKSVFCHWHLPNFIYSELKGYLCFWSILAKSWMEVEYCIHVGANLFLLMCLVQQNVEFIWTIMLVFSILFNSVWWSQQKFGE